jgi:enterochelin esterase family protein
MKHTFVVRLCGAAIFALLLPAASLYAQSGFPSTEVHPDGSITFRYSAPAASEVKLGLEGAARPLAMTKDAAGVWSYTTAPLAPEIYNYHFEVDGQSFLDPQSTNIVPNLVLHNNWLLVPGATAQPWERTAVPHGVVHHHFYTSASVRGLTAGLSDYFVYTPPGYDPRSPKSYPALYLLHGYTDSAEGWSTEGRANLILDNLIASGKAKPMIVIMPLGYGDMSFVRNGFSSWNDPAALRRNLDGFSQSLLTEIIPQVEAEYRVSSKASDRAIAGLSMGGLESLLVGLSHPEKFGWVGGFSAALRETAFDQHFNGVEATAGRKLVWIACGAEEELLPSNRAFIGWLKKRNIDVTAVETPGLHTWMVWRDDLVHFAPLLFQD